MAIKVVMRRNDISKVQASISSKSVDAVRESAKVCRDFASATSPVRTGALQASWYVSGPGDETSYPERSSAAKSLNPQAQILSEAQAAVVDPSFGGFRNVLGQFSNPEAIVSSAVNYSVFLEEGTRYMAPRPILRPASEAARNAFTSTMSKVADT